MKKTILSGALALSVLGVALAQTDTATSPAPALPPLVTTGDTRIDDQVRALHKEMNEKMKALREEYQRKLKAIIGERKAYIASSSQQMKDDRKAMASSTKAEMEKLKEARKNAAEKMKDDRKAMASSTKAEMEKLKEARKNAEEQARDARKDIKEGVRGTSTRANPQGNAWGFFRNFFNISRPTSAPAVQMTQQ